MKLKLLVIILLLLGFGITKTKSESKKVEETQLLSKELKGFEADYLTKAEFRKQVKEHKKIFGWFIDLVVNWVTLCKITHLAF